MTQFAAECGASAGRGAYAEALAAAEVLGICRRRLNTLFRGENADHFVFTLNCTDALNLAMKGLIDPDESPRAHAICTHIDHNSILRPLAEIEARGWCEQTRVGVDSKSGLVDPDDVRRAIRPNTRLIAITHVSNVSGTVQPIREIGKIAREHNIPFVVDAAQSAGHVPIDVRADFIDLLAAPGHKGLLGPGGTGFLYVRPGVEKILRTSREGGTGSASEELSQPTLMPDRYEAGSQNAIGIAGLSAGVDWVLAQTVEKLYAHEMDLVRTFMDGVADCAGLTYVGPQGVKNRVGVFSVRIDRMEPHEVSAALESSFGILTRSGLHCAPLAHAALGTLNSGGTTRVSFGPFLTMPDVQFVTDALADLALSVRA